MNEDFDKEYEYLSFEVNTQYFGLCEGQKSFSEHTAISSANSADWNEFNFWCFQQIDISKYVGFEPNDILIRLSIEETVDNHWLDSYFPTPYLLDAMVTIECGEHTQEESMQSEMTYDRRTTSSNYPYPHEIKVKCQEIECAANWEWNVFGSCPFPILSFYYFVEHYDNARVQIKINERIFRECGPVNDRNVNVSIKYGMRNVRTCFEYIEISHLLLPNGWNTDSTLDDSIKNRFRFGIALLDVDVLDGITDQNVADFFINLDCLQHTTQSIKNNNDTFGFLKLSMNINNVDEDVLKKYYKEIETRFVYTLNSTLNFDNDANIPFNVQSQLDASADALNLFISATSHTEVMEIKEVIEMDIFLFSLQQTLRDSHFSQFALESIDDIKIIDSLPEINSFSTSTTAIISTTQIKHVEEDEGGTDNFIQTLIDTASVPALISFFGALVVFIFVCLCCLGLIAFICVNRGKNKDKKYKFKKTQSQSLDVSDSDLDELQGMIIDEIDSHGIISHKSRSIKTFLAESKSAKSDCKDGKSKQKISFVSRTKNEKFLKYGNKIEVQLSEQKKTAKNVPKSKENVQKVDKALIVSQTIMESLSESESGPSGIDLSEEYLRIDDEDGDNASFDMEDYEDMHEIKKKHHKRKKSKKMFKLKNKKYLSVQQIDKDKKSDNDEDSDELSEVGHERYQSLNSLTVPYSQQI